MVEWVVGAEIQVLVGVSGLSVYMHFHLPIFLMRDQRIKKWDTPLWLVCKLYAPVVSLEFSQFILLISLHHLEQIIVVLHVAGEEDIAVCHK